MANKEKKQQVANNTFQELKPDPDPVFWRKNGWTISKKTEKIFLQ